MIDASFRSQREKLTAQLRRQGISDSRVLQAISAVPREEFIREDLREFAYRNQPLPIDAGQTISQPYIVALMAEVLELSPEDRVLEIGAGSGYAAAILSRLCAEVYAIEWHQTLAESARTRLERLGYDNVNVISGDGTLGWPDMAPFDGIAVAAGGPQLPEELLEQLKLGGRLVIPVGPQQVSQKLIRVRRDTEQHYEHDDLGDVRFVPLVGQRGWQTEGNAFEADIEAQAKAELASLSTADLIARFAERFSSIETADLDPLLDRIGEARVVLIGESTHGTSEFYRMRAEITRELIERKDFSFVAIEGDWPDVSRVNDFVTQGGQQSRPTWNAFERFPEWMWRNREVLEFVSWLREYNMHQRPRPDRVGFYGLDLYSLFGSIQSVLDYLERVDPKTAEVARQRYGCLTPWEGDPQAYGRAALTGKYRSCEEEVTEMLRNLLERQMQYAQFDGAYFMDASLNAKVIAAAEKYYRIMYYGGEESWNHRDRHMVDTLESLLDFYGQDGKAVVWAHNSHLGDATATEMGWRGQTNVGALCRERFEGQTYSIGQLTDHGTVAAAPYWGAEMEIMSVRPGMEQSYERQFHDSAVGQGFLPLGLTANSVLKERLAKTALERAIGVIYRPQTELQSHYFQADMPAQFDEVIWFDETSAVTPLTGADLHFDEEHHPFALID